MKWLRFEDLHKYVVAKYTNKLIHNDTDHYFKDELISKRRGRNLEYDRLAPFHNEPQGSFIFYSKSIYNQLPPNLTRIDQPNIFKTWAKKYFLNPSISIPIKPRLTNIIQPYNIEHDMSCDISDMNIDQSQRNNIYVEHNRIPAGQLYQPENHLKHDDSQILPHEDIPKDIPQIFHHDDHFVLSHIDCFNSQDKRDTEVSYNQWETTKAKLGINPDKGNSKMLNSDLVKSTQEDQN